MGRRNFRDYRLLCFLSTDCPRLISEDEVNATFSGFNDSLCYSLAELDRIQPMKPFTAMFGYVNQSILSFDVRADKAFYTVIPFKVLDPNDIGATLKWQLHLTNFTQVRIFIFLKY